MTAQFFSPDYFTARARFRAAAQNASFELFELPINAKGPQGEALSIDVARRGTQRPRATVVVSSGTHGIEGFFGSAVQLALLEGAFAKVSLPEHVALVLIHAVNPFGFAHVRRVNENNVDLNRNFLLDGRAFAGAPEGYRLLHPLLNPKSPPKRLEAFWLRAGQQVLKHGFLTLKNAIAQGQYEFPDGLFFGGKAPTETQRILRKNMPGWIGTPERVIHLDLHTGLGRRGTYALCVDLRIDHPRVAQLGREFGAAYVQGFDTTGVLYEIQGGLGRWLEALFPEAQYDCILAEFGTINSLSVLAALRNDNRAHLYGGSNPQTMMRAKRAMMEAFCPTDPAWRREVVDKGVRIVQQALLACA